MLSLVNFLAVLVGAAVANPTILLSDEHSQQNREISSSEYLRKIFENYPLFYFSRTDEQSLDDVIERLQALKLREAANIARQVDLRQIIRDSELSSVTLCMPSDQAVQKWRKELPEKLKPNTEALKKLVKAWIVPGRLEFSQLTDNKKVQSLNGAKLRFNVYNDLNMKKIVTVNGARITDADKMMNGGLIHKVDKVIYPLPVGNVVETLADIEAFSTIVDLLKRAELQQELSADPITVIAPTNTAFQALPAGVLDDLERDEQKLKNVLRYHMISDVKYSAALMSGQQIRTSQGDEISVSRDQNDQIFLNKQSETSGAPKVILRDIPTTNGVVQVVDRVVLPPQRHFVLV